MSASLKFTGNVSVR